MTQEKVTCEAPLARGAQLGPYVLGQRIALGGMAEIWSARRSNDGLDVALKVLLSPFSKDENFRMMFRDEVKIATQLTHENIVRVYDAHEIDGYLFLAMELIEGKDVRKILSSLVRQGKALPVPLVLWIVREVARGLSYAHGKRTSDGRSLGIVHRDISPHNVLVAKDGRVKLIDFGIARAGQRLTRTRTGIIKGKIAYMAPEQALAAGITLRTDIFATGIVFWEMLAMRRLFKRGTDVDVIEAVVRAEAPPIREENPDVPQAAADLLHRMLAQKASDRPSSMREVENGINRILARDFEPGAYGKEALSEWSLPILSGGRPKTVPVRAVDHPQLMALRRGGEDQTEPDLSALDPVVSVHDTLVRPPKVVWPKEPSASNALTTPVPLPADEFVDRATEEMDEPGASTDSDASVGLDTLVDPSSGSFEVPTPLYPGAQDTEEDGLLALEVPTAYDAVPVEVRSATPMVMEMSPMVPTGAEEAQTAPPAVPAAGIEVSPALGVGIRWILVVLGVAAAVFWTLYLLSGR